MAKVVRDKEMTVPRGALFRAITEFEKYPDFLSEVVGASVLPGGTECRRQVVFELELVKRFKYTLEFRIEGEQEVAWKLIESNFFKTNDGIWKLKDVSGERTLVHYELEVSFGFLVPGWISKKLTEVNLLRMFEAFETRAAKLA